jgi:hypothetical protein
VNVAEAINALDKPMIRDTAVGVLLEIGPDAVGHIRPAVFLVGPVARRNLASILTVADEPDTIGFLIEWLDREDVHDTCREIVSTVASLMSEWPREFSAQAKSCAADHATRWPTSLADKAKRHSAPDALVRALRAMRAFQMSRTRPRVANTSKSGSVRSFRVSRGREWVPQDAWTWDKNGQITWLERDPRH